MKKIIYCIIVLILVNCMIFASGTIEPWKKIQYSSIDFDNGDITEQIRREMKEHPENCIGDLYVYAITHATNEAMYSGENPYCITFVFWSLKEEVELRIEKISVNIDKNQNPFENFTPVDLKTKRNKVKNPVTGEISESTETACSFSTPYVYNLSDSKDKEINVSISVEAGKGKKDLNLILRRNEKKGLFKWRF